jgi:nucleoside-diphosphate-sugar epimerase
LRSSALGAIGIWVVTFLDHLAAAAMGKGARLVPVPPGLLRAAARAVGRGEMARRLLDSLQVDISDTRETLGWEPPVSVDEGLRRAVAPLLESGR